jgi:hypothetical protein
MQLSNLPADPTAIRLEKTRQHECSLTLVVTATVCADGTGIVVPNLRMTPIWWSLETSGRVKTDELEQICEAWISSKPINPRLDFK